MKTIMIFDGTVFTAQYLIFFSLLNIIYHGFFSPFPILMSIENVFKFFNNIFYIIMKTVLKIYDIISSV